MTARHWVALLVAGVLGGCAVTAPGTSLSEAGGLDGALSASAAPLAQVANGPLTAPPSRVPLQLRLGVPRNPVHLRFAVPPQAGLLFDLDTGEVLWRRNPTKVLPIASLTKIMTALVVASREPP